MGGFGRVMMMAVVVVVVVWFPWWTVSVAVFVIPPEVVRDGRRHTLETYPLSRL
jgi:hypothetical protein